MLSLTIEEKEYRCTKIDFHFYNELVLGSLEKRIRNYFKKCYGGNIKPLTKLFYDSGDSVWYCINEINNCYHRRHTPTTYNR